MQATIIISTILLLLSAINVCEAWLEEVVIDLKNPYIHNYSKLNKQEHLRSAVYAQLVAVPFYLIAAHYHYYWLFPAIFINRRLVFDPFLKIFRKRPFTRYEGDGAIDGTCKKIFGENGAWKEILFEVIISAASIYFTC